MFLGLFLSLQAASMLIIEQLGYLQQEYLSLKDARIAESRSVLQSLALITVFGLEEVAFLRVHAQRVREVNEIVAANIKRSLVTTLNWASAYLAFSAMLAVQLVAGMPLTYSFVVPATKMVSMLFVTTGFIPKATETWTLLKVSAKKISQFLATPDIAPVYDAPGAPAFARPPSEDGLKLSLQNASFGWQPKQPGSPAEPQSEGRELQETGFQLRGVSLQARAGTLVVIVGSVGSGKSSLLRAICNEMAPTSPGDRSRRLTARRVAYFSQKPWVANRSVLENIRLNLGHDEALLLRCLAAARLGESLSEADLQKCAGRHGGNLSGGQRARLAFARAGYQW